MGDITDWLLGSQDPYPDPFDHEYDEPSYWYKPTRCKYCGSSSVTWSKIEGKWRLYTHGKPHTCNAYTMRRKSTRMARGRRVK